MQNPYLIVHADKAPKVRWVTAVFVYPEKPKGRKGKGVTIISGLPLDAKELQKLAKQLKRKCGAGGTVKGGNIEIQGEHRDFLIKELQTLGYKAKRAGG